MSTETSTTTPGASVPEVTTLPLAKAINRALRDELEADAKTLLIGEDIGALGGVFRVTDWLQADFGADRVIDSPLAESGIIGTCIGLAMRGYRPVAEIQFDGFVFPAFNQITTQLAKIHNRTDGAVRVPVTIRIPYGGHIGSIEHHSESPEALFAHTAGLRIITPSSPHDAYWMTRQAIRSDDPVIVLEPKRRYWLKGEVDLQRPAPDAFTAQVLRPGTDVTLAAYGPLVPVALAAAEVAAGQGRSIEVVDVRSISPLDDETIAQSAARTQRLVVAHEAPTFGGFGAEIAARVTERAYHRLAAPVLRVGGFHMPYPPSAQENRYLPDIDRMLEAVERSFAYASTGGR
ncbi:alpha-ketoacid dehydrogenase subunit beta [Nesterenkonia alkaliphila]|uniref:3-methyl-2-oxobutanoate dehydrogenase (2-methylpropanoyl-transferring) n=1 Tax=Nesterenkonia alkaliphila TaxID=1463631 RepID=A0A7K1UJ53_9MICC|nr:transketolase C-terminal domain-containing protein [Nesterenkonia alkaliphila]MVT26081.1 alpha-ketoacid dehydrogenase subunit beta [Nesterenkonia alkaliphila]GFZ79418.1 2-oxoisovalerate dehydrogenase subunit beta [Nesterenkonia alkaliphila]